LKDNEKVAKNIRRIQRRGGGEGGGGGGRGGRIRRLIAGLKEQWKIYKMSIRRAERTFERREEYLKV
jgi:hypothetical protein